MSSPRRQRPYRILSLDGGGAWALIQARTLGELYGHDCPGRDILNKFSLVAANSGGSLVAGGLAVGMTPSQLYGLFKEESELTTIFVERWWSPATRLLGFGSRYDTAAKLEGLRDLLGRGGGFGIDGDTPLNQLQNGSSRFPDFLISAFDYDRKRAAFFRSNSKSRASSDPGDCILPTLAEVLHASSNAPVNYFDAPAEFTTPTYQNKRYWDGGIAGLNNPVLAAVIESIANGVAPQDITALSIGTATVMLPLVDDSVEPPLAAERKTPGLFTDLKKLAKAIVDDPPDAATYEADQILGIPDGSQQGSNRLVRMNPVIQPVQYQGAWNFPGYPGGVKDSLREDEFSALVTMDMDAVLQEQVDMIVKLCDLWLRGIVPNQPIQSNSGLICRIGQDSFRKARIAAHRLGLI